MRNRVWQREANGSRTRRLDNNTVATIKPVDKKFLVTIEKMGVVEVIEYRYGMTEAMRWVKRWENGLTEAQIVKRLEYVICITADNPELNELLKGIRYGI